MDVERFAELSDWVSTDAETREAANLFTGHVLLLIRDRDPDEPVDSLGLRRSLEDRFGDPFASSPEMDELILAVDGVTVKELRDTLRTALEVLAPGSYAMLCDPDRRR